MEGTAAATEAGTGRAKEVAGPEEEARAVARAGVAAMAVGGMVAAATERAAMVATGMDMVSGFRVAASWVEVEMAAAMVAAALVVAVMASAVARAAVQALRRRAPMRCQ